MPNYLIKKVKKSVKGNKYSGKSASKRTQSKKNKINSIPKRTKSIGKVK